MGDVFGGARVNYLIIITVPFTYHVSLWFGVIFDRTSFFFKMLKKVTYWLTEKLGIGVGYVLMHVSLGLDYCRFRFPSHHSRVSYLFEATFSRVPVLSIKGVVFTGITGLVSFGPGLSR